MTAPKTKRESASEQARVAALVEKYGVTRAVARLAIERSLVRRIALYVGGWPDRRVAFTAAVELLRRAP